MTAPPPPPRRLRRALVLLPSTALGGAEAMTAVLARALDRAGLALELAIEPGLAAAAARLLGPPLAAAVQPAPLGWREEEDIARNLRRQEAVAAARLLADPPDLAVVPLPWPSHGLGFLGPLRAAGLPTLLLTHLAPREPDLALAEAARRAPPPDWPGLVWAAVAAPVAARVESAFGLAPGRVRVVPNGVPVPRIAPAQRRLHRAAKRAALGLDAAAPLIVAAGRLEPKKGSALLPDLARALRRRCGATLVALGEGPAMPALAADPAAAGPAAPLRLPGRVEDVGAWLLAADALLLPSRLEGCPLVFLEAAARRCPVVATEAALEAFGAAAWEMAALAPEEHAAALVDQAEAVLRATPAARALRVEAAFRQALAWDEAAMLEALLGLLRAAAAAAGPLQGAA